MEGVYFYFFSWCWVIVLIFIIHTDYQYRTYGILFFLLLIVFNPISISIFDISISFNYFYLLFLCTGYVVVSKRINWMLLLILSFIIALGYGVFLLIALYDPAWIFMNPTLLLSFGLVCLGIWLGKGFDTHVLIVTIGILQGDLLLAFLLYPYGLYPKVMAAKAMDCLVITWSLLATFYVGKQYVNRLKKVKKKGTLVNE